MKTTEAPIVVTAQIKAPINDVWQAISELNIMKQWYFDSIPSFKPEVGFETSFKVHNEGRTFTHDWKLVNVIPQKQLSYKWTFQEYKGASISHFKLKENGTSTLLTVEVVVLEDFPDDIPEFTRESCEGGWTYFIPGKLKSILEKNKPRT